LIFEKKEFVFSCSSYPVSDPAAVEPETMAAVFFPDSAARLRSRLSTAGAAFLNSSSHHDHQSD